MNTPLKVLLNELSRCQVCSLGLPLGARPVIRIQETARLLIISQAPGTKAHDTGLPFNDASGDRLREWLGLTREVFYDATKIAFMPMGFCYPGRNKKGGDLPPRQVCAPLWHSRILALLPQVKLTLLVGRYAQDYYLKKGTQLTLATTVHDFEPGSPWIALPHPSWRNNAWLKKNPWFEQSILPQIRQQIHALLQETLPFSK